MNRSRKSRLKNHRNAAGSIVQQNAPLALEQLESRVLLNVDLPGMHLVDPSADYFDGQVVYLDFDGEENVTYNGPVIIDGISVPAFSVSTPELAGQAEAIIADVTENLNKLFSDSGVIFTAEKPDGDTPYSTIFIGGDDSAFLEYGSFKGLAEQVDIGNKNCSDVAFVFSDNIGGVNVFTKGYTTELSEIVAHETGHLLGYAHDIEDPDGDILSCVAGGTVTTEIYSCPSQVDPGESVNVQVRVKFSGDDNDGPWQVTDLDLYDDDWAFDDVIATRDNPFQISSQGVWYYYTFYNINLSAKDDSADGNGIELKAWAEVDDNDWNGYNPDDYSPIKQVTVTYPELYRTPSSLDFGSSSTTKYFYVDNTGGGTLSYSISDNTNWISVSPTSGSSTGEQDSIKVTVNRSGLSPGSYSGTITIDPSYGSNQYVNVYMAIPDPDPTASRVSPGSPITIPWGTNQGFTVRGNDAGGDLDKVVWNLAGPESYSDTNSLSGSSDTANFTDYAGYTFDYGDGDDNYTLTATVYDDSGDTASVSWSIHVNPKPLPVLDISAVDSDIFESAEPGDTAAFYATVDNIGAASQTETWTVEWYFSTNTIFGDVDDRYIGSYSSSSNIGVSDPPNDISKSLTLPTPASEMNYVFAKVIPGGDYARNNNQDWIGTVGEDSDENNDNRWDPTHLGEISNTFHRYNRTLDNDGEDDFYKFTIAQAGQSEDYARIDFDNNKGNLKLELWTAGLTPSLLATSDGIGNSEQISLNGRPAGDYMINICGSNRRDVSADYDITIEAPPPTYPDLDVLSVTGTQLTYYIGDKIWAEATVKNTGNKTAEESTLDWYLGTTSNNKYRPIELGAWLGEELTSPDNNMSPNETDVDEINWGGWEIPNDIPVGTYSVYAFVKTETPELDTANNVRSSAPFEIKQRFIDLQVISVTDTDQQYKIGDYLNGKVTVKNIGNKTATGNTVYYYLGTETDRDYKLIAEGSIAGIDGLEPQEDESDWVADLAHPLGWKITDDVISGTYYLWVHAVTTSGDPNTENDWEKSVPFEIDGRIDEVRWEYESGAEIPNETNIEAGTKVYLALHGTGFNPSKTFSAWVRETDGGDGDPIEQKTLVYNSSLKEWRADWTVKWMDDGLTDIDGMPDYIFKIDTYGNKSKGEINGQDIKPMNPATGLAVQKSGTSWNFDWADVKDQNDPNGSGLDHYVLVVANNPAFTDSIKYDTGIVSGKTVSDLNPDYYYWKVEVYDKAGNEPSVSANGQEFGSTVTDLWWEDERGRLKKQDSLTVGQTVILKVATKGLADEELMVQIYEDDGLGGFSTIIKDDKVGGSFTIDIQSNGYGEAEWVVPWMKDKDEILGIFSLGDPEYFFRIDEYNKDSISIDAEGTDAEKGNFFMVVPWQIERGEDLPVVLGWHRPLLDWSDPNLDYATVEVGGDPTMLYSQTSVPLGSGSESYNFSDNGNDYYEIPNDPFWYTIGYIKASDWHNKVSDGYVNIESIFKYSLVGDGGIWDAETSYNVHVIDALPDWSNNGWYQGDTHWHSDITDSNYLFYSEYGTPLAIMDEIAPYLGLDWITITDHSFDIDDLGAADTYRNISDYKSSPTLYNWDNIENNPIMNFNGGFGYIKGEENSIDAPGFNISPIEQYHMLSYGFSDSDNVIVGGRGFGVDFSNGSLLVHAGLSVATLITAGTSNPIDDVVVDLVNTAYSQAVYGQEKPMKTLSETMTEVTNLSGINNISFSYVAHPLLEDDNAFDIGFATPWSKDSVEDALGYEKNGEKVLRGFEFWNGQDDDDREGSLALWEELLVDQLAGNAKVDMNHNWYLSGGSDDHFSAYLKGETQPGDVQTVAWASSFNQNSILESFYNGTTLVTDGPLFAMGADPFATNLDNYGIVSTKMGQELELTSIEEGRLIFDWPDQSDCNWDNISLSDITVKHYYEEMADPNTPDEYLLNSNVFDTFWAWFNGDKTPGWHAYRAELEIGTYKAYTNPIWMCFDNVPDPSPIVEDATITILEGSTATDTVSATGGFGDKDFHIDSGPNFGELVFNNEDGSFTYISYNENFNGEDSFTYYATDEIPLASNIGIITIEINPVNDAPSFTSGNNVTVLEDSGLYSSVWATNLSAGPTDDESSQVLTFDMANDNPSVFAEVPSIDSDGVLTFEPAENAFGTATFTVTLRDDGGTADGGMNTYVLPQSFVITVEQVNDAPVPVTIDQPISVAEDTTYNGSVDAVDVDGDVLSFFASQPSQGTLEMHQDGTYVYKPAENFFGDDSFVFWANDGQADSEDATVLLTVESVNDVPAAAFDYDPYDVVDGRIVVAENEPLIPDDDEFIELDLLGSDIEDAPEALVARIDSKPQKGSFKHFVGNRWRYTPYEQENGYDSFTYVIEDTDGALSLPTTVLIDIMPWNSKPVATSQDIQVQEDGSVVVVLTGDDVETPTTELVFQIYEEPQHGAITQLSNGTYRYEPFADYAGSDSFEFTVTDNGDPAGSHSNPGDQTSLAATVSIEITPVNDKPIADDFEFPADDTGEPAFITLAGTDVETPDLLTAEISDGPTKGQLAFLEGRNYEYVVNDGESGSDSFTFRLIDPEGALSNPATVFIDIRPVNQTPIAEPQTVAVDEDSEVIITLHATDMETPEEDLVFTPTAAAHGTLTLIPASNNQYLYKPVDDFFGSDSFTFTAMDNGDPAGSSGNNRPGTYDDPQTSHSVTVTIAVAGIPDPSIPINQSLVTEVDSPYTGQLTAEDVDNEVLSYHIETQPRHGTVELNSNGIFIYVPNYGYYDEDVFTFGTSDSKYIGTVDITVGQKTIVRSREKYTFQDADGDDVTVIFIGPAGATMEIIRPGDFHCDLARVVLNNTDERSSLRIITKGRGAETTITDVIANGPLGMLSAKTTDITGSVQVNGGVGKIMLDDIPDNTSIFAQGALSRGAMIMADQVGDNVNIALDGCLKRFRANDYMGGSVSATSIGNISVAKGRMGADINSVSGPLSSVIAYGSIDGNISSEGSIKKVTSKTGDITGSIRSGQDINSVQACNLSGAILSAAENIGKVRIKGDILDSYILGGYDIGVNCELNLRDTSCDDLLRSGDIGAVIAKGEFSASFLSAGCAPDFSLASGGEIADYGSVGQVRFGSIEPANDGSDFGILAHTGIGRVQVGRTKIYADYVDEDFTVALL